MNEWQTTFIARRSEKSASHCTEKNAWHSISSSSAALFFWCTLNSTHAPSFSMWRKWRGRFALIDVIFIYFWSVWCCVWHYDFWTLCVCRVQCSEGHLRMFVTCNTLIFVNWIRCRALTAAWWKTISRKGRSYLHSRMARHVVIMVATHKLTHIVRHFLRTIAFDRLQSMINDNHKYVSHVTNGQVCCVCVRMDCLRWCMNFIAPRKVFKIIMHRLMERRET